MARKKFDPSRQPTESREFTSSNSGYKVRVVRGMDSVVKRYFVPENMTGKDFRQWVDDTRDEVQKYINFKLEGDVNAPKKRKKKEEEEE